MSFTLNLYRNNSEKIALDKSLTLIAQYTGDLKAETSIVTPTILVQCDLGDVVTANYAYIPTFQRYYFITNITSVRKNLVQFDMHCDVLSSFKTQIRNNEAVIKRQESQYNLYIEDKQMRYYNKPIVTVKEFPQGFEGFTAVLAIAGASSIIGNTVWIIEGEHNSHQDQYTTVEGGTGVEDGLFLMGATYFKPTWTQGGVYYQNNLVSNAGEQGFVYADNKSYIECYRTNIGGDTLLQEGLCVYANSDPNDETLLVKHNLYSYTADDDTLLINLPHRVKYVKFEWAEVGAS